MNETNFSNLIQLPSGEKITQQSIFDNQGSSNPQRHVAGSEAWLFDNQLLTLDEVCAWLRVKKHRVYGWTSSQSIPFQKVGGSLRFDRKAVWRGLHKK